MSFESRLRKVEKAISNRCKHEYVAMKDGTNDLLCVKCRKFAMQAVATVPNAVSIEVAIGNAMSKTTTLESIAKELEKQLELGVRRKGVM